MAFGVAAWNLHEGLAIARKNRAFDLVDAIRGLNKDIVVLSDAFWLGNPQHGANRNVAAYMLEQLETETPGQDEGYTTIKVDYGEEDWPGHKLVLLSRLAISQPTIVNLGKRNAGAIEVEDPDTHIPVTIIGAHFTDQSEGQRLAQVDHLLEWADLSRPTILAGDLNAMPGHTLRSRIARNKTTRSLAAKLPARWPFVTKSELDQTGLPTIPERLGEMAVGETLRRLEKAGLYNTNRYSKPTMPSIRPVWQLDHILKTRDLSSHSFEVHPCSPGLSDHRPISVTVET